MFSFDTNILVYAADENSGERHRLAADLVRRARDAPVALTEQSIFEFVTVVTRKAKLSLDRAMPYVEELLATFTLIGPSETIVKDVFALVGRYHIGIWDARILAVCNAHGCTHLVSEDLQDGAQYGDVTVSAMLLATATVLQDGAQYGDVTVIDPFSASNTAIIGSLLS